MIDMHITTVVSILSCLECPLDVCWNSECGVCDLHISFHVQDFI